MYARLAQRGSDERVDVAAMLDQWGLGLVRRELEVLSQCQLVCRAQVREQALVNEPQLFELMMVL